MLFEINFLLGLRREYCKRFPDADIEPEAWPCPVCRNTVKWTKKCIVDHLKTIHSMSREEFEGKYSMPEKHLVDAPEGIKLLPRTIKGKKMRFYTQSGLY